MLGAFLRIRGHDIFLLNFDRFGNIALPIRHSMFVGNNLVLCSEGHLVVSEYLSVMSAHESLELMPMPCHLPLRGLSGEILLTAVSLP